MNIKFGTIGKTTYNSRFQASNSSENSVSGRLGGIKTPGLPNYNMNLKNFQGTTAVPKIGSMNLLAVPQASYAPQHSHGNNFSSANRVSVASSEGLPSRVSVSQHSAVITEKAVTTQGTLNGSTKELGTTNYSLHVNAQQQATSLTNGQGNTLSSTTVTRPMIKVGSVKVTALTPFSERFPHMYSNTNGNVTTTVTTRVVSKESVQSLSKEAITKEGKTSVTVDSGKSFLTGSSKRANDGLRSYSSNSHSGTSRRSMGSTSRKPAVPKATSSRPRSSGRVSKKK